MFSSAAADKGLLIPGRECRLSCHSCGEKVSFILLHARQLMADGSDNISGTLWMDPSPLDRVPVDLTGIDEFPDELRPEYESAIEVFNGGHYRPAVGVARTVFEGIGRHLTGRRAMLGELIKELRTRDEFSELIQPIFHVLQNGGNLAAHFERGRPISEEIATHVLDLLDYLLEYLYLLPKQVAEAAKAIQNSPDLRS